MRKFIIFILLAAAGTVPAVELFVNTDGSKSISGKFFILPETIQCGEPSTVEVSSSGENLNITLTSRRNPGWQLENKGKADDDTAMFGGETAEVFLMPENSPDYYQLALNPSGHLYSARRRDKSWNPQVKSSVEVLRDHWIARFSIPFSEFGAAIPRDGSVWKANFAISIYDGNIRKYASWSPTSSFHDTNAFGKIIFTSQCPAAIKSWNIKDNTLYVEFFIPEKSSIRGRCVVAGKIHPAENGKAAVLLTSSEIGPKNFSTVDIQLVDGEKIIHSERPDVPWQVRGAFNIDRFYVFSDREANYRHELASPVTLQIIRDKKVLKEITDLPSSGRLPLDGIAPGKITVSAVSRKDGTFVNRVLLIRDDSISAPPLPSGDIVLDGKIIRFGSEPVFMVGTTGSTSWHLVGKENFNLDLGTVNITKNGLPLRQLPVHRLIRKPTTGYLWKNDWQKQLDRVVTTSPVNRLHRICYEVQMDTYFNKDGKLTQLNTAAFIRDLFRQLKKQYPDRLFTVQCDHRQDIHLYADNCDVLEAACWSSSYAENLLPGLQSDMQYVRRIAKNKPVIFWLGVSVPNPESRCAEELRAGVYSAVFNDMAGVIFHLGHGGISGDKKRIWSLISGINSEIAAWYKSYADGEKLPDFILEYGGNFIVRAWKYNGKVFIGAVNRSASGQTLHIKHRRGEIKDKLAGYDAVIYEISE